MKADRKTLLRYGILVIFIVIILCIASVVMRSCKPQEIVDTIYPTATLPTLDELLSEDTSAGDVSQISGVVSRDLVMITHRPKELRYLCIETEQELIYTLAIEAYTNHSDLLVLHRVAGQWSDDQVVGYNAPVVVHVSCGGDRGQVTQVGELRQGLYIAYNLPWSMNE